MTQEMTTMLSEETWEERRERQSNEFREKHLPFFFETMKEKKIEYFTVEFNGGGDDGCVEDPVYVKDSEIPSWSDTRKEVGLTDDMKWDSKEYKRLVKKADALHRFYLDPENIGNTYVYVQMQWDNSRKRYNMNEYINEFVCMYMSAQNIDWYNNEGGSGTFTYHKGQLYITGQTYYREEDSFEFEELDSEVVKNG